MSNDIVDGESNNGFDPNKSQQEPEVPPEMEHLFVSDFNEDGGAVGVPLGQLLRDMERTVDVLCALPASFSKPSN